MRISDLFRKCGFMVIGGGMIDFCDEK